MPANYKSQSIKFGPRRRSSPLPPSSATCSARRTCQSRDTATRPTCLGRFPQWRWRVLVSYRTASRLRVGYRATPVVDEESGGRRRRVMGTSVVAVPARPQNAQRAMNRVTNTPGRVEGPTWQLRSTWPPRAEHCEPADLGGLRIFPPDRPSHTTESGAPRRRSDGAGRIGGCSRDFKSYADWQTSSARGRPPA